MAHLRLPTAKELRDFVQTHPPSRSSQPQSRSRTIPYGPERPPPARPSSGRRRGKAAQYKGDDESDTDTATSSSDSDESETQRDIERDVEVGRFDRERHTKDFRDRDTGELIRRSTQTRTTTGREEFFPPETDTSVRSGFDSGRTGPFSQIFASSSAGGRAGGGGTGGPRMIPFPVAPLSALTTTISTPPTAIGSSRLTIHSDGSSPLALPASATYSTKEASRETICDRDGKCIQAVSYTDGSQRFTPLVPRSADFRGADTIISPRAKFGFPEFALVSAEAAIPLVQKALLDELKTPLAARVVLAEEKDRRDKSPNERDVPLFAAEAWTVRHVEDITSHTAILSQIIKLAETTCIDRNLVLPLPKRIVLFVFGDQAPLHGGNTLYLAQDHFLNRGQRAILGISSRYLAGAPVSAEILTNQLFCMAMTESPCLLQKLMDITSLSKAIGGIAPPTWSVIPNAKTIAQQLAPSIVNSSSSSSSNTSSSTSSTSSSTSSGSALVGNCDESFLPQCNVVVGNPEVAVRLMQHQELYPVYYMTAQMAETRPASASSAPLPLSAPKLGVLLSLATIADPASPNQRILVPLRVSSLPLVAQFAIDPTYYPAIEPRMFLVEAQRVSVTDRGLVTGFQYQIPTSAAVVPLDPLSSSSTTTTGGGTTTTHSFDPRVQYLSEYVPDSNNDPEARRPLPLQPLLAWWNDLQRMPPDRLTIINDDRLARSTGDELTLLRFKVELDSEAVRKGVYPRTPGAVSVILNKVASSSSPKTPTSTTVALVPASLPAPIVPASSGTRVVFGQVMGGGRSGAGGGGGAPLPNDPNVPWYASLPGDSRNVAYAGRIPGPGPISTDYSYRHRSHHPGRIP